MFLKNESGAFRLAGLAGLGLAGLGLVTPCRVAGQVLPCLLKHFVCLGGSCCVCVFLLFGHNHLDFQKVRAFCLCSKKEI